MNKEKISDQIAEVHYDAIIRRKAEYIEEVMDHVFCNKEDKETIKRLIDDSFQEGVNTFMLTQLEIMVALDEEGC